MALPSYSSVLAELGISPEELETATGPAQKTIPQRAMTQVARALDNLKIIPEANTGEDERVRRMQAEFDRQKEQEAFEQSAEGQVQQEYEQSLADEGMRNYAPRDELSQNEMRLLMQEQANARQAALARRLGIKLGQPTSVSIPSDAQVGPTPSIPDPSIPAIGTPTGGEILETGIKAAPIAARAVPEAVGEVLQENPELVAEIVNPVVGAAGARRDVINLADEATETGEAVNPGEMLLTAASGIPIVGKGGKAVGKVGKKVAEKTMKELAEDAASKAIRGTDEAADDVKGLSKAGDDAPLDEADELLEESVEEAPLEKGTDDGAIAERTDGPSSFDVGDDATARSRFLEGNRFTRENHKYGESVSAVSEDFAQDVNNKIFMTPDGGAGTAVTPDGEIVSAWSRPDLSTKATQGLLGEAMRYARIADAYDINGVLPNLYRKYDMVPVARVAFDPAFVKPDWDFSVYGRPDVVMLVRDPQNVLGVKGGEYVSEVRDTVPVFDSWAEAAAHQRKLSDEVAQSVSVHTNPPQTSTFEEFLEGMYPGETNLSQFKIDRARELQLSYIQRALAHGVPVPPRVLQDFPEATATIQGTSPYIASPKADLLAAAKGKGLQIMGSGESPSDGSMLGIYGFFEDQHIARQKELHPDDPSKWRARDPINNPDDFEEMVNEGTLETLWQLQEAGGGGKEWYDEVMARAFELSSKAYPELAKSETQRVLLTALAAITSPGMQADLNFDVALELYGQLFPRAADGTRNASGKLGRITGYNPTKQLDERGVGTLISGSRGPGIRKNLLYLQELIDTHGPEKTAGLLFTPETFEEMEAAKRTWGSSVLDTGAQHAARDKLAHLEKHGVFPFKKEPPTEKQLENVKKIAFGEPTLYGKKYKFSEITKERAMSGEVDLGAYAFGPKVGPFLTNLNGLPEKTADLWWTRLYNRIRGETTMINKKGKRVVIEAPRSFEERETMKRMIDAIAERTGLKDYQVQSALWFYEQKLARQMGAKAPSTAFDQGAELFLKKNKIPLEE